MLRRRPSDSGECWAGLCAFCTSEIGRRDCRNGAPRQLSVRGAGSHNIINVWRSGWSGRCWNYRLSISWNCGLYSLHDYGSIFLFMSVFAAVQRPKVRRKDWSGPSCVVPRTIMDEDYKGRPSCAYQKGQFERRKRQNRATGSELGRFGAKTWLSLGASLWP